MSKVVFMVGVEQRGSPGDYIKQPVESAIDIEAHIDVDLLHAYVVSVVAEKLLEMRRLKTHYKYSSEQIAQIMADEDKRRTAKIAGLL
jgi:hypothetical protein